MPNYARHIAPKTTPQTQPIPGRDMVRNNGGGFGFAVDKWTRLERFLILGCEGGHFQVSEQKLTMQNAECIYHCLAEDAERTVRTIVEISESGRAPKNGPAVFALAIAASQPHDQYPLHKSYVSARKAALIALPRVCRIFTDLADFISNVTELRGWGRGLRQAVARWYNEKPLADLAYQMTKYQNRNGYTQRDVLRLSHPNAYRAPIDRGKKRDTLYEYGVGRSDFMVLSGYADHQGDPLRLLAGVEEAKRATRDWQIANLIHRYGLVREHIPTEFLNSPRVWEALLEHMPMTAMIRNLGKMTSIGLISPLSEAAGLVAERLRDRERLRKARVHPFSVLLAQTTYAAGRGVKGDLTWNPVPQVVDALDNAFYSSFEHVQPTGKRHYLAIDVSASMSWGSSTINNTHITARVGAACMAMTTLRTEPNSYAMAFSTGMQDIGLSRSMRLDDVVNRCSRIRPSGTNCAAPMLDALERKIPVDCFTIFTDNDTNSAHTIHPSLALEKYRQQTGIPAKLAVVAMSASHVSIADPRDAGMLDIAGFDASCPAVLAEFAGYKRAA